MEEKQKYINIEKYKQKQVYINREKREILSPVWRWGVIFLGLFLTKYSPLISYTHNGDVTH